MAAQTNLDRREPGMALPVLRAVLRMAATLALLFLAYAELPDTKSSGVDLVILAIVLAGLVLLIIHQIRSILRSMHPALRALEVLITLIAALILIFSSVYLAMSHSNQQTFNTPLDHLSALYFTVVTFSTVGYGDIAAKTGAARLLVTIQILLDIAFIGVVVRLIVGAVQKSLGKK